MLKLASRAEAQMESHRPEGRKPEAAKSKDGLKAALVRTPVIAAVDLGASKVACFIMKPDGVRKGDRTLTTAGVGYVQSRGVRGGSIVNLDEASEAIAQAVERAEGRRAEVNVQSVVVSTAGGQLTSHRVAGRVSIGARPISDNDLWCARSAILAQIKLPGRRAAHILPIAWSVDGQGGVRDPRAMFGRTLGVELLVVSVSEAVFQTLEACVERAHLQDSRGRGRRAASSPRSPRWRRPRWTWAPSASTWAAARRAPRCSPPAPSSMWRRCRWAAST